MTKDSRRAAVYARFSSEKQRAASIEDQVRNCRTYATQRGWAVVENCVFTDYAMTGQVADRPGYQAMQRAAKARQFDVLIVDDLSRLSRDSAEVQIVQKRLKFRDIGLVAIADGINTIENPQSSGLIMGLKAAMNEEYLRDLAEKTRRGLAGRVYAGLSPGGQAYGYTSEPVYADPPRLDRHGQPDVVGYRRVIVPEEAAVVREIFKMYRDGLSTRRIAEALNARGIPPAGKRWRNRQGLRAKTWSSTSIFGDVARGLGILHNECYLGKIIWNKFEWRKDPDGAGGSRGRVRRVPIMRPKEDWIVVEDESLRIVSNDLWEETRREFARRSAKRRHEGHFPIDGRHRYLLSGLLRCGICGAPLAMGGKHGYSCTTRANRSRDLCANAGIVNRKALEVLVLTVVREKLYGADRMEKLLRLVRDGLEGARKQRRRESGADSVRRQLTAKREEIDSVTAAIRRCREQGRVNAAEHLETELETLLAQRKALESQQTAPPATGLDSSIMQVIRDIPATVRRYMDSLLTPAVGRPEPGVGHTLADLVEEVVVSPARTEEGRRCYRVTVKGALASIGRILSARMQASQVAGAGFEPATSGL